MLSVSIIHSPRTVTDVTVAVVVQAWICSGVREIVGVGVQCDQCVEYVCVC